MARQVTLSIPGVRGLSAMFAVFLAALLWLSSCTGPPLLRVSDVSKTEDGMTVRVSGVVVDLREYESGYTSVMLADHASGDTVQVLLPPPPTGDPASEASIGDEVLVEGAVSLESTRATIFADSGCIRIISRAAFSMSVELVCSHWRLFEFDRFNVSGVIAIGQNPEGIWLTDPLTDHRLRLASATASMIATVGARVVVDCTLLMDPRTMSLYLRVWNVTSSPT